MDKLNEMKVVFDAKSQNEGFSRVAAAAFVMSLDPTAEEMADIKTAVSEAVTNCIVHGYKGEGGKIYLNIVTYKDKVIKITIRDKGCGIPDVKLAMEPLYTTGNKDERAGLGFAVMEAFMDKLRVSSTIGKGTAVIMYKKIGKGRGN